jgi:hypothetical protein
MPTIRVIKLKDGELLSQHVFDGDYTDDNLPAPPADVAATVLTTHEELAAAGVSDFTQVDIVDGQLVIDTSKPGRAQVVAERRARALAKLAALDGDPAITDDVRAYLVAIRELLGSGLIGQS